MRRYTTPTQDVIVEGVDLTGCDVYVTYKQGSRLLTAEPDMQIVDDGTLLSVPLSQLDTAGFKCGTARVQVNYIYPSGERSATNIISVDVTPNLLEQEVEFHG